VSGNNRFVSGIDDQSVSGKIKFVSGGIKMDLIYNTTSSVYNFTDICKQHADQLQIIKDSTLRIPKVAFIVLLIGFLFLITEYLILPIYKNKSFHPYFVGLFGWIGTCIVFFGTWLLVPFVFVVESQWQMIYPSLIIIGLLGVLMFLGRRKKKC
jgi:hypothetical protein